jgi:hypothetical protein
MHWGKSRYASLMDARTGEVTAVNWKSVVQLCKYSQNWPQYTVPIYKHSYLQMFILNMKCAKLLKALHFKLVHILKFVCS